MGVRETWRRLDAVRRIGKSDVHDACARVEVFEDMRSDKM
jgi:hypothetical protein